MMIWYLKNGIRYSLWHAHFTLQYFPIKIDHVHICNMCLVTQFSYFCTSLFFSLYLFDSCCNLGTSYLTWLPKIKTKFNTILKYVEAKIYILNVYVCYIYKALLEEYETHTFFWKIVENFVQEKENISSKVLWKILFVKKFFQIDR